MQRFRLDKTDERPLDNAGRIKLSKIQKELFGTISTESMPNDLQEEMTKLDLNISNSEWNTYSCSEKGRLLAASIIKNRIEMVRRIYDFLETNKRAAMSKGK